MILLSKILTLIILRKCFENLKILNNHTYKFDKKNKDDHYYLT